MNGRRTSAERLASNRGEHDEDEVRVEEKERRLERSEVQVEAQLSSLLARDVQACAEAGSRLKSLRKILSFCTLF